MASRQLAGGAFALLAMMAGSGMAFTCQPSGSSSSNFTFTSLGCYNDSMVSILSASKLSTIAMTPQLCANYCGERGFGYGGIEFGTYVLSSC
jgi:xylan 1,4-beta-xylosidase